MLNNDTLRRLRFATDLSDPKVLALIAVGGREITREDLHDFLKKESDDGMRLCPDDILAAFLNGLIVDRRGPRESDKTSAGGSAGMVTPPPEKALDNNKILKKIRVAFSLRDEDVQMLLRSGNLELSRSELNALFRNPQHKNFKPCGDQVLRQILAGLTRQYRPDQVDQ